MVSSAFSFLFLLRPHFRLSKGGAPWWAVVGIRKINCLVALFDRQVQTFTPGGHLLERRKGIHIGKEYINKIATFIFSFSTPSRLWGEPFGSPLWGRQRRDRVSILQKKEVKPITSTQRMENIRKGCATKQKTTHLFGKWLKKKKL
jgi:hypothetical protein